MVAEKENGVLKYRYIYGAAGDLSRQEELNSSGTVIKAVCYEYDSLDRLIRSWEEELKNGVLVRGLSTEHIYDTSNRLIKQSWKSDTDERSESYTYNSDDGTLSSLTTASGEKLDYTYDYLKRLQSRTDGTRTTTYNYQSVGDAGTSTQVSSVNQSKVGSGDLTLGYEYDALQNIKKVTKNGTTAAEYTYDNQLQLTNEKLPQSNLEYNYSYDTAGNIRSVAKTENGSTTTRTYTYGDSSWKDLLTAIDGHAFTYDEIGNPLKYYNGKDWTFTWVNGRKLNTAVSGSTIVSYQYGADDLRLSKTVSNVTHNYLYLGEQLVEETWGNNSLKFAYDEQGRPYSVNYNGTTYYYILNQQGDVIYIVDANGNIQTEYVYNAWGEILEVKGTAEIGSVNPLRYRGYYYDTESGFYYVSNRYYDAVVSRFLNADAGIAGVGGELLGCNMFAYSFNNPVNMDDQDGNWPKWVQKLGNAVKKSASKVAKKVKSVVKKIKQDVKNFNIKNKSEKKVLKSNYFSAYKGKVVVRTNLNRSGSYGALFITRETNQRKNPEDVVRHEYGHTKQLDKLGVVKYTACIGVPSLFEWGDGEYYDKPWEVTADIYGDVQSRNPSDASVAEGFDYLENSYKYGILVWFTID